MARLGSIPSDGRSLEFLKEQRQRMSAWANAEQQFGDGGGGFGGVTDGLHAIRSFPDMLHMGQGEVGVDAEGRQKGGVLVGAETGKVGVGNGGAARGGGHRGGHGEVGVDAEGRQPRGVLVGAETANVCVGNGGAARGGGHRRVRRGYRRPAGHQPLPRHVANGLGMAQLANAAHITRANTIILTLLLSFV
nr:hypothetical protein L484_024714 [Ipomoea batatas]